MSICFTPSFRRICTMSPGLTWMPVVYTETVYHVVPLQKRLFILMQSLLMQFIINDPNEINVLSVEALIDIKYCSLSHSTLGFSVWISQKVLINSSSHTSALIHYCFLQLTQALDLKSHKNDKSNLFCDAQLWMKLTGVTKYDIMLFNK